MLCPPAARPQTYCFGLAASMGAFLLGAGTKGKRYSMPNARIMIHQPLGGASGAAVDIEIQASSQTAFLLIFVRLAYSNFEKIGTKVFRRRPKG